MYDVVALGELLIDFTENGDSAQGNPLFEANPGGAPCNVLSLLQHLGNKTTFIGNVGDDMFGRLLKERAEKEGIDMSGLSLDKEVHTTLAFVHTFPGGDRDFSFYRKPGADINLTVDDVKKNEGLIRDAKIFHIGTLSMTDEPACSATEYALKVAKESGCLISFDPNYRAPLWDSVEKAKEKIRYGFSMCDILKISDNEIELMTGETDLDKGIAKIREEFDIRLIFATAGPDGSKAYYKDIIVEMPGFKNENTIETTGAGDTFCGSALHFALEYGIDDLDEDKLKRLLTFANAAASLITTRKGALSVMPTIEEVESFLKERS
ncbi:MAG: carbohydrate kinase [Lachnospiraceae bacterium]|nr:carbohydrate kinase [Lachnospiraceae bacterium]